MSRIGTARLAGFLSRARALAEVVHPQTAAKIAVLEQGLPAIDRAEELIAFAADTLRSAGVMREHVAPATAVPPPMGRVGDPSTVVDAKGEVIDE